MTRLLTALGMIAALLFAGLVVLVLTSIDAKAALLAFPAMTAGLVTVLNPMLGLGALVALSQLDALANIAGRLLPVSAYVLLTAAVLLGIVLKAAQRTRGQRLWPNEPALRFALLFLIAMVISTLYAGSRSAAFSQWDPLLGAVALTFAVVYLADTTDKLLFLMLVHVGASAFQAAVIGYDTVTGGSLFSTTEVATEGSQYQGVARSAGASDRDPMNAAAVLSSGSIMAFVLFLRYPHWRALTGLTFVAGCAGAVLSLTRSAAIIVFISLAWVAWSYRRDRHLPLLLVLGLGAMLLAIPLVPEVYWERLTGLLSSSTERSANIRWAHNLVGVDLFVRHPLVGIGPNNFPGAFLSDEYRHVPFRFLYPEALHNSYLRVAVEYGLLGFSAWAAFLVASLNSLRAAFAAGVSPDLHAAAWAILVAFGGYLIFMTIAPPFDHRIAWILPGFAIAAGRLAVHSRPQDTQTIGRGPA